MVWLPVALNLESKQLVAVAVHQNLAKKLDWTRLLNTMKKTENYGFCGPGAVFGQSGIRADWSLSYSCL